ncbi:MAG: hypothetical protein OQK69_12345 [Gammaproteobacteria bacterium]|nr:hypothetical protein [Gammaproteobacteria bacterium]
MSLLKEIIGPKSKYEKDIPYTYEARIKIIDDEYNSFLGDTICALVEHLTKNKIKPEEVEFYEIFKDEEKKLDTRYCISDNGQWLSRKELCVAFKEHYAGHIHENGCTFEDREKDITGP